MPFFGISPKLPIIHDDVSPGFDVTKTINEAAQQNLKHLILTCPGEKMMDPDFGVGLRRFLFEPNLPSIHAEIEGKIFSQVNKYLPYMEIIDLSFQRGSPDDPDNHNALKIKLKYLIKPTGEMDVLEINSNLMI